MISRIPVESPNKKSGQQDGWKGHKAKFVGLTELRFEALDPETLPCVAQDPPPQSHRPDVDPRLALRLWGS